MLHHAGKFWSPTKGQDQLGPGLSLVPQTDSLDAPSAATAEVWIANPSHPQENFAEKWRNEPSFAEWFYTWPLRAVSGIKALAEQDAKGLDKVGTVLENSYGATAANQAVRAFSAKLRDLENLPVARSRRTYILRREIHCACFTGAREWNPSMPISRTIVPWACEWLLHFEAWLYTAVWKGVERLMRRKAVLKSLYALLNPYGFENGVPINCGN